MNSKIKLLLLVGVITALVPVLNFPRSIKNMIIFILGISIVFLAFGIKRGVKTLRLKLKRIEGQQGTMIG
ncbi:MAG: hypothetical protein KBC11_00615 [Candidatus Pacebacteria bacterium]|nr:hypothetical protein [Candidatus Paceibacterota bacterium]